MRSVDLGDNTMRTTILSLMGFALMGAAPRLVHAVDAAAQADDSLAEVIVTAERRSEKAQDVPVAITALSASDMEQRGVRQASDIAAAVPNLTVASAYGDEAQPSFALRG